MYEYAVFSFFHLLHLLSLAAVAGSSHTAIKCSMKSYKLSELTQAQVNSLKARPRIDFSSIFNLVRKFIKWFFVFSFDLCEPIYLGSAGLWCWYCIRLTPLLMMSGVEVMLL